MTAGNEDDRKRAAAAELIRGLNRFAIKVSVILGALTGLVAFVALVLLRHQGILDPSEYTITQIVIQTLALAGALIIAPSVLICTGNWFSTAEGSDKWFAGLGFVIIFIVMPAVLFMAFCRWISGH